MRGVGLISGAKGWAEEGIEAGTRWGRRPKAGCAPDCGVGKLDFEIEIG